MAGEISTIQSLKAVDAWIDVINANINGGVRTAFKASRLKFSGTSTDLQRAGTTTSLPLQFPEPGLQTANTVIDFSQGAITTSTETTHLAIQGDGYFLVATPDLINTNTASATFGTTLLAPNGRFFLTRDGEFHTNAQGLLANSAGLFLVTYEPWSTVLNYDTTVGFGLGSGIRAVYNDIDGTAPATGRFVKLSVFAASTANANYLTGVNSAIKDNQGTVLGNNGATVRITGEQSLTYSTYGSTIFDMGFRAQAVGGALAQLNANVQTYTGLTSDGVILTKSLEASNASMTQSVPELSLAQKLFSALTKVLQTKQTNVDGVLNLVR
jgi:flagellar hook protein FlgE